MGLIPIQVYLEQPWLSYWNLTKNVSHSVAIENLPDLMDQLATIPDTEIVDMEDRIEKLRENYFFLGCTKEQIAKFMLNPMSSQLKCQALPSNSVSRMNYTKTCS